MFFNPNCFAGTSGTVSVYALARTGLVGKRNIIASFAILTARARRRKVVYGVVPCRICLWLMRVSNNADS
jgi:hypothetical protein